MLDYCADCPFKGTRPVPSELRPDAPIAVIGEAPGEDEDKYGRPFVGTTGQVQDKIQGIAGLRREDCSFLNVLKCHPPTVNGIKNNIKTADAHKAIGLCQPRMLAELQSLRAKKVIVPVGNTSLRSLGIDAPIGEARGSTFDTQYGQVLPTWHPGYIVRQWQEYDTSIRDWKKIKRYAFGMNKPLPAENFHLFPTVLEVEQLCSEINSRKLPIGVDIETYYARPTTTALKLISFSWSPSDALVIPFINEAGNYVWANEDEEERVIMAVGSVLENPNIEKIFQYGIFDITVLLNHGFKVVGPIFDIILAHYLIYEPVAHDLAFIVSTYADYPAWKLTKGKGDDYDYRKYNARDTIVLHLVKPTLENEIKALKLEWLMRTLNGAVIPTARMAVNGIQFNTERRDEIAVKLATHLNELQEKIETLGHSQGINLNSTKQVSDMLFKTLKLRSGVKTDGGALSTNEDVLKKLVLRHPESSVPQLLLDYREAEKIRSTYIDPPVNADGRVHSTFSLHTTVTGRFSSSEPNLENLPNPARDKTGFIRTLYTSHAGGCIIESDRSQVELRIFAQLANDLPWLTAFDNGEDIHKLNMIDMYGEYVEEFRTFIKNFIYGIIYGSEGQEIERVAPLEFLRKVKIQQALINLWSKHPALFSYKSGIEKQLVNNRRIISPFGRIRWFPSKPTKENLREAINFPIQSAVADGMHFHFAILDRELDPEKDKIILQLHDSFYIETSESRADTVAKIIKDVMETAIKAPNGMVFKWPIEQKIGKNMGEMRKLHG